jgi:hypothetical protein
MCKNLLLLGGFLSLNVIQLRLCYIGKIPGLRGDATVENVYIWLIYFY